MLLGLVDLGEDTARLLVDWERGESGYVVLEVEDLKETGGEAELGLFFSGTGVGGTTACGS